MLKFYKKAIIIFFSLLILTVVAAFFCIDRTFLNDGLLPAQKSVFPWRVNADSDILDGGSSTILVNDAAFTLDYNVLLVKGFEYPYVSLRFTFIGQDHDTKRVDLTNYSTVSFSIKCAPDNVLTFRVYIFDEIVTEREGEDIYRVADTYFTCENEWKQVELNLNHLEVQDWWIRRYQLDLSHRDYSLNQVAGFTFGTSGDSPKETPSNIKISELTLLGHDWRFMYGLGIFVVLSWGGYAFWFVRQQTLCLVADLKDKLQKNRPLIAYQQLSIEPQRDKDKLVIRFIATEYANPELNLEVMSTKLGISRTKINDILKEELGYTFSAYLNKLRLTEAARLLSREDANVGEIAYSVGYRNVPYFNKLFKNEYGCVPKAFKGLYDK